MRVSDLQRSIHSQALDSARLLRGPRGLQDAAVHASRKGLKRARAGLRLLHDATDEAFFIHANARLRDAARPLSRLRDGGVLLQKLRDISGEVKTSACRNALAGLRRQIANEQRRQLAEARHIQLPERSAQLIVQVADDIKQRQPGNTSASVILSGVARIYRKGRAAMKAAAKHPTDANLHEARKHAKYLHHALELLAANSGGPIGKLIKRSDVIGQALGDDHDLVMLESRLAHISSAMTAPAREHLAAFIRKRREKLQKKALKQGKALYARKLKSIIRSLNLRSSE